MVFLSTAGQAADYVFGNKGAIYCETEKDLALIVATSLSKNKDVPSPNGCGTIPPGAVGSLIELKRVESFVSGAVVIAFVAKGKPVYFLTVEDEIDKKQIATKTESTDSQILKNHRIISPRDVRNTPDKWQNRPIEFKSINVYWVDNNDVRFITSESVTLFATDVSGDENTLKYLKENCETEREAISLKCRVNVKFSYYKSGEDQPSGWAKRTTLISADAIVTRVVRR
jgi:hypothetical protein